MANEESLIGLLLRAHKECAAQSAIEQYANGNADLSSCYEAARQHVQNAIWQCVFAERCEGKRDAEKKAAK